MGKAVDELNTKLTKTEQNKQHQQKLQKHLDNRKKKVYSLDKSTRKTFTGKGIAAPEVPKKKKKKDSSGFQKTF